MKNFQTFIMFTFGARTLIYILFCIIRFYEFFLAVVLFYFEKKNACFTSNMHKNLEMRSESLGYLQIRVRYALLYIRMRHSFLKNEKKK